MIIVIIKKTVAILNSLDIARQFFLLSFLYRATCRLRLWDTVIRQTMTMNLRLAEYIYVIAFYSPCDCRSYVIYHDWSEVSLVYKSTLRGSGIYNSWYHGRLGFYWYKHPHPSGCSHDITIKYNLTHTLTLMS